MINPSLITQTTRYHSQGMVGTLNGRVIIDEGRGKVSITEEGGQERTRLDLLGLTTIRSNATEANRVGQARSDLRDGIWTAKPTEDLRDLGI